MTRSTTVGKKPTSGVRVSRARVTDDDATIHAILREEFTAADLQKYAEIEPLVPAEQVLEELEKAQRQNKAKKKAK
jgi:hypothetical protein